MGHMREGRPAIRRWRSVAAAVTLLATLLTVGSPAVHAADVPISRDVPADGTATRQMGSDADADGQWMITGGPGGQAGLGGDLWIYRNAGAATNFEFQLVQQIADGEDLWGQAVAIDAASDRMLVGSQDGLTVYEFNGTSGDWEEIARQATSAWVVDIDMNNGEAIIALATPSGGNATEIRAAADNYATVVQSLTTPAVNTQETRVTLAPASGGADTWAAVGNVKVDTADPGTENGLVYLYKKTSGTWSGSSFRTLENPDSDVTNDRWFGSALASADGVLFVGHALESNDGATSSIDSGAVWVYEGAPDSVDPPVKLKAASPGVSNAFGQSLDYDPDSGTLAVGEPAAALSNPSGRRGRVHAYQTVGATWTLIDEFNTAQGLANDRFGQSVAIATNFVNGDNNTTHVLVGDNRVANGTEGDAGAAYIYRVIEPDPPSNKLITPFNNKIYIPDFRYGASVALDSNKLIVGGPDKSGRNGFVFVYDDTGTSPKYPDDDDQLLRPTDNAAQVTNSNFGEFVAADGGLLAIGYGNANQVDIYELSGGTYGFREAVTTIDPISAIDISGNSLIVGSATQSQAQLFSFDIAGFGTVSATLDPAGPGPVDDVAVSDDFAATSVIDKVGSGGTDVGEVQLYHRTSAVGETPVAWALGDTLANPDTDTFDDVFFGESVAIDDTTLVIGVHDTIPGVAPFSGALWIYEETGPGTVGAPVKIKEPTPDVSNAFGFAAAIDGDIIVTGNPGGGTGFPGRSGEGHIIKRDPDTGIWTYDSGINPADPNTFDEGYGFAVAIDGGDLAIGAPQDDNLLGVKSGAVYYWDTTVPDPPPPPPPPADNPVLTLTTGTASTTTPAGATGISVVDLPPTSIEGYGGSGSSNIVGTSLNAVEGADDAGANELLTRTTLGDLDLQGALLDSILLSDVVIDGGWDAALAGTIYAGLPLQNVTLAQALSTGNINTDSLQTLDLSATPVGAIPVGAIALADTPVGGLPLPGGQDWCDLLLEISPTYNCTTTPSANPATESLVDLTIAGTPVGAIPVGAIPVGAIDIENIPVGAIPVGAIDIAGTPVGAIPVGAIPVGAIPVGAIPVGAIPVGAIPVGAIPVGAIPVGAIDVAGTPVGAITLGDLTDNGGVAASPVGAIPVGAIPVGAIPVGAIPVGAIPVGAIPVGAIPVGAIDIAGTPVGAIPVGAIDVAGTPVGAIPVGAIPVGAIPVGAIPVGAIPVGAIPVGAIDVAGAPVGAIPVGAIPVGAIDLVASPVGAIPVGAIPVDPIAGSATVSDFVDCSLIDCDPAAGFTLADAQAAGALLGTATIADFQGLDTGVTFGDLVGVDGYSETDLRAQIDAATGGQTLSQFLTFDDMILSDLPQNEFGATTVGDLGAAAHALITLADLLDATGGDEATLVAQLNTEIPTLADFESYDGMVLSDLPITEALVANTTINQILPAFQNIRLGDILDFHPDLVGTDVDWQGLTLADINDWQDVTLAELATYNGATLAEVIAGLSANLQNELTFGDLLLAIVGTEAHDWGDVELDALDLEASGSPISFATDFTISGGSSSSYSMTLRTTIPAEAIYVPGSSTITALDDVNTPPIGSVEPIIEGNQLTWDFGLVRLGEDYTLDFEITPSLTLGTNQVSTVGEINGFGVQSTGFDTIGVTQAFEPNDIPDDALTAFSDTIYASHIGDADDVDLYRINLDAGSRLAVSLSDLPADFDLVVYGPPTQPVTDQPALRQLNPTEVPDITLDATENNGGGALLQDVPLQDLPVVGVSNNRDTENESIDIASVRSTGDYFIQVSGYSGATSSDPYALYVKAVGPPAPLVCAAQNYQSPANSGTLPSVASLTGVNTLILVNEERLHGKYGPAGANQTLNAVDNLVTYTNVTNTSLGITAAVVPVDGDGNVSAAYDALDNASCDPDNANAVVREINRVIDDMRDADPNTEITHLMMVGDDDIIPMARLADDTTIANESGYAQTFSEPGSGANSYFGALVNSNFLSDEPYGDLDPIQSGDRILYVTDMALGRLVETPAEIEGQILAFIGFDGQLDTSTALVTGYDFLDDGAQEVAAALAALPDTTDVNSSLISEDWTDDDLAGLLVPSAGTPPQIASINAHYDHYRVLPADQNASGMEDDLFTTSDLPVATAFGAGLLAGRSLHSMGCHGGLSVPDGLFSSATDARALDWAQAYARQGATWVGNTGYGYGETEGVELSERLMALYSANLDGSVSAGEALFYAKQTYLGTQQAEYGAFDEKVLQQATFYGIPFYQFDVTSVPPPAPLPPQPVTVPVPGASLDLTTVQSAPSFTPVSADNGAGRSYEASVPPGDLAATDQQATPYRPIQPTASFDVSYVDSSGDPVQVAQGAIITALTTTDIGDVNPDLALPIVDDSGVEVEPDVGDINTDPAVYVSTYETPEGQRQALSTLLGTFTSDQADGDGTQRLFEEITLDVYYRDPNNDSDQIRPTIADVESEIAGNVLTIDATVTDDQDVSAGDNIIRVNALVVEDAGLDDTPWTRVELVNTGGDRWSGSLALTGTEVEYLVQAVDGSGNTALTTNKSRLFADNPAPPPPPGDLTVSVSASTPPANSLFYSTSVTMNADAQGDPIDYQVNDGPIVTAGPSASVVLDPSVLGDGAHTVTFTAPGGTVIESVVFDTTDPEATIASPASGGQNDEGTDVLMSFSCADAASGITSCDGTLDGSTVNDGELISGLSLGSHTLSVSGTDGVGRTVSTSATFDVIVVDVTDPVVTAEPLIPDGENGWFITSPVTIAWDTVDGDPNVADPPDTIAALEGTNDYQSEEVCDSRGNCATGVGTVSIDTVDPTAAVLTPTDGALLNNALIDITTDCSDDTSGIASCVYTINGGDPASEGQVTLVDGEYSLEVTATDVAGNTATTSITFEVDTTAPAVIAEPLSPDGANGWFVTSPVTIAWDADGAPADPPDTTAALEGTNDYESAEVCDAAGNCATGTVSVSIDTVNPTAVFLSPADGAVFTEPLVTVNTNCADASSGIASCALTIDGNDTNEGSVTLPDGVHTLVVTATDAAGLTSSTTITIEVDTTAPVVAAEPLTPDGDNGWFITSPVTIVWDATGGALADPPDTVASLEGTNDYESAEVCDAAGNCATGIVSVSIDTVDPTATVLTPADGALLSDPVVDVSTMCGDVSSGVASCVVSIDGGPASDGENSLSDGPHTLEVTATDEAGRTTTTSITFEIDSTSPVITAEALTPDGDNGWFITSPVTIAWDAVDPTPSSGGVTDPPDSSAALEGTNDYESDEVCDAAGNCATGTVSVSIDTVDPVATVASPADGAVLAESLVSISTNCSDATSDIASCVISLDGNPAGDGQVTLADGTYTLAVTATDVAGRTTTNTISFEVDTDVVGDPLAIAGFAVEGAALVGDLVDLAATFTGDQAPHSVTIDWGDGTVCTAPGDPDCVIVEASATADGEVTASHAYSTADSYTVTMTITSDTGEVATETATVYACTIAGTSGDDILIGTNGRDIICGLGGDDIIKGLRGNDVLVGGGGDDWIDGHQGRDVIFGGPGNDTLFGLFGNDALYGGSGDDVLRGSFGRDDLFGGTGDDKLYGGSGNDWITGNRGDDRIWGQGGHDTLRGGRGEDQLWGSTGDDTLIGGADDDELDGGPGWDLLKGKAGDDLLKGGPQSDELRGGVGTDTCLPGPGFFDALFGCEL